MNKSEVVKIYSPKNKDWNIQLVTDAVYVKLSFIEKDTIFYTYYIYNQVIEDFKSEKDFWIRSDGYTSIEAIINDLAYGNLERLPKAFHEEKYASKIQNAARRHLKLPELPCWKEEKVDRFMQNIFQIITSWDDEEPVEET